MAPLQRKHWSYLPHYLCDARPGMLWQLVDLSSGCVGCGGCDFSDGVFCTACGDLRTGMQQNSMQCYVAVLRCRCDLCSRLVLGAFRVILGFALRQAVQQARGIWEVQPLLL